jgi:hypothetical protein
MKLSSSFLSKAFAALLVSTAANTVNATAYQVANTNDSGAGSLRQAITDSNASDSSADTITFGVTGTGTITLNSGLPAISSSGGALTITGPGDTLLTINGNQGDFSIFSVASGGNLFISGVTVSGAHFTSAAVNLNNYGGGAFYNKGTLSVSNSTISNNFSSGNGGGGFYNDNGGTLSISNSTITKKSTESISGGGAIFSFGTLTINNSNISKNSAPLAGAINSYASLSILNSSFDENIATNHDSGALRTTGGTATISNSSFINNSALYADGGAFKISGNATVSNCTISGNAQISGQVYNNGSLTLTNTIIANSRGGSDFLGLDPTTNTNNLVETPGNSFMPSITADPKLGPLQNNGGFTKTMALLPGSPAIGSGNSTIISSNPINGLDQRGFSRISSDIGAYSYDFAPTGNIVVSKSSDNQLVLSLASGGVTLSDLHSQYSGNNLTITTTGATAITTVPNSGIAGVTTSGTTSVTTDMTAFQGFSGLTVVGNSNADNLTVTSPGIDLTTVSGGSTNQSVTLHSVGTSQMTLNAAATPKGNGGLSLGAGTLSVNLANITTTGGDQSYTGGIIVNNGNLTLNAGGGAINLEATTNSNSASHPHYDLTVRTTGDVAISGDVGANEALGNFRVEGNDISLGNL